MATHASPKDLLTLANALDGTDSFPIAGAAALSSTLAVTGAATFASTCAVTGALTGKQKTQTVATSLYTVVNSTDGDIVIFGAADNDVVQLPDAAAGNLGQRITVVNVATAAAAKLSISPHASDKIYGGIHGAAGGDLVTFGAVADKDIINTKATALKGDYAVLVSDGSTGWYVVGGKGVWASE
jgi:hypothetical protein